MDGQILPGGLVLFSKDEEKKSGKLLPLKVIHNKYNKRKTAQPKRKFLAPRKNESIGDFCKRVDSDSRKIIIEKDREALRLHRSLKNKKKREKRASRNHERKESKTLDSAEKSELELTFSSENTIRPSFGDTIDCPPTFSSRVKDKLEKSKKETKSCNDLTEYVKQVRKAYLEIKERRILNYDKLKDRNKGKHEKKLIDFGDGWVGIGKFRQHDE
ncbi:Acyl-protein thioesterase 1 [Cryptosporidium felis]|nr:Acyl-protein thioesterase 1 [Cryptosporidium felis]